MESNAGQIPGAGLHEAPPVVVDPRSLSGLLERVRIIMGSDTSTLLLLDGAGSVLEPAASAGLGRRWRGATHVPVGSGFAGRVAAECKPVLLEEVNESTVLNPILRDFGLRQLYGVPVMGTESLLGVLHTGWRVPRDLSFEDGQRLTEVADDIGRRLSAQTQDDAHLAALALQRSLLPPAPPHIEGLDIAVRYLPADGDLGGDWYDILSLPSGSVGFVMGDIEGHGLKAAVAMGRMRSALRAYALDYDDPAVVLERLDRKINHYEPELTATVVYAVTRPPFETITISIAGHPMPLLALPGGRGATPTDLTPGLLLGVEPGWRRSAETIDLPEGGALAMYTDGLVERRTYSAQGSSSTARLELVQRAFVAEDTAETACTRIIAEGLGDDNVDDDVALVVVRRTS